MTSSLILSLGRPQGMGEVRRVASWQSILEAADCTVSVDHTLDRRRQLRPRRLVAGLAGVATGAVVPETLAWSGTDLTDRVARLRPDVLVIVSSRAYVPELRAAAPTVVLDLVDRLSVSYRQRSGVSRSWTRRAALRGLAALHHRFEGRSEALDVIRTAAGWADAAALHAEWVPVVAPAPSDADETPTRDHDAVFIGNLAYEPNLDALRSLADCWPTVRSARPDTSLLVAGANPNAEVTSMATNHGWTLLGPFEALADVCARARLAVAPLRLTAGIQIKVLDTAAYGLAQLVTPQALLGFAPNFPATIASPGKPFAEALVRSLSDSSTLAASGAEAQAHVREHYGVDRWAAWVRAELLGHPGDAT